MLRGNSDYRNSNLMWKHGARPHQSTETSDSAFAMFLNSENTAFYISRYFPFRGDPSSRPKYKNSLGATGHVQRLVKAKRLRHVERAGERHIREMADTWDSGSLKATKAFSRRSMVETACVKHGRGFRIQRGSFFIRMGIRTPTAIRMSNIAREISY